MVIQVPDQVTVLNHLGRVVWQATAPSGEPLCPPQIKDLNRDGHIEIVATATDGQICCLQGADGNKIWDSKVPRTANWPVIEDIDGDGYAEILITNGTNAKASNGDQGLVSCLDSRQGKIKWTAQIPFHSEGVRNLMVHNSGSDVQILVGQVGGWISRIEGGNGHVTWNKRLRGSCEGVILGLLRQ